MEQENKLVDSMFASLGDREIVDNVQLDWLELQPKLRRQNFLSFGFSHLNIFNISAVVIAAVLLPWFLFLRHSADVPASSAPLPSQQSSVPNGQQTIVQHKAPKLPSNDLPTSADDPRSTAIAPISRIPADLIAGGEAGSNDTLDYIIQSYRTHVKVKMIVRDTGTQTSVQFDTVRIY